MKPSTAKIPYLRPNRRLFSETMDFIFRLTDYLSISVNILIPNPTQSNLTLPVNRSDLHVVHQSEGDCSYGFRKKRKKVLSGQVGKFSLKVESYKRSWKDLIEVERFQWN